MACNGGTVTPDKGSDKQKCPSVVTPTPEATPSADMAAGVEVGALDETTGAIPAKDAAKVAQITP